MPYFIDTDYVGPGDFYFMDAPSKEYWVMVNTMLHSTDGRAFLATHEKPDLEVHAGAIVSSSGTSTVHYSAAATEGKIWVEGTIRNSNASGDAVRVWGGGSHIWVEDDGSIIGRGANGTAINLSVSSLNTYARIDNFGRIEGHEAIRRSGSEGVEIHNYGTIQQSPGGVAYTDSYGGWDIIFNFGRINGEIDFGGGNDGYYADYGLYGEERYPSGDGVASSVHGGDGNDMLVGGKFDDYFYGDNGNDTLRGGHGDDKLSGGADDDFLEGGAGADEIDGGAGVDRADFEKSPGGVSVDLLNGIGARNDAAGDTYTGIEQVTGSAFSDSIVGNDVANVLAGGAGDDIIYGKGGSDVIKGQAGKDQLYGGNGNDNLLGGNGNDRLFGNSGFDKLYGGAGNDQLTGGADADYFVFETQGTTGFGGDIVIDFQNGLDRLDMRGVYLTSDPGHAPIGFADLAIGTWTSGMKIVVQNSQIVYLDDTATGIAVADIDASDFLFA